MPPVDSYPNITECFLAHAIANPDAVVYSQAQTDGTTIKRNYREVAARVNSVAAYLRNLGVGPQSKVAILSATRPEWMEADLAILLAGGVSVSIYQSLPAREVAYILFDSGADLVFVENEEQAKKVLAIHKNVIEMAGTEDRPPQQVALSLRGIISFEDTSGKEGAELVTHWSGLVATKASPVVPANQKPDDLAALVYTSGTTGPPKGVMQTHRNHLSNVRHSYQCGMMTEGASVMLFLPLAHSFAKLMGYIGFLTTAKLSFPAVLDPKSSKADPQAILRDIRRANAEIVPVVPRFLEKMKEGIEATARKRNVKGRILSLTLRSSRRMLDVRRAGKHATLIHTMVYEGTASARRKIKDQLFGTGFRFAVSGGAKLPVDVADFFEGLGIEVLEGYGLTETCVATNVNRLGSKKIGTVGPVLAPDIELKLCDDGEIMFRGPNVTPGYYLRPTATRAAWDADGWFHTGDLGSVDHDGFLTIVGRKKELIVTSGGKKIPPQAIEDRLTALRLVSQAVLLGDGKPFCVALLTLDKQAVEDWKGSASGTAPDREQAALEKAVWEAVESVNETLSSFETIKNILIVNEEFTIDNGLLTPTFKTKRKAIEERYRNEIEQLYKSTKR